MGRETLVLRRSCSRLHKTAMLRKLKQFLTTMYHVREQENSERVHTIIICKKFSSTWALIVFFCYTRPVQTNWWNNFQYEAYFKSSFIMQFTLKWNVWSPKTTTTTTAPQLRALTVVVWTANGAFRKFHADVKRSCDRNAVLFMKGRDSTTFPNISGFLFFRSENISVDRLAFTFRTCRYC